MASGWVTPLRTEEGTSLFSLQYRLGPTVAASAGAEAAFHLGATAAESREKKWSRIERQNERDGVRKVDGESGLLRGSWHLPADASSTAASARLHYLVRLCFPPSLWSLSAPRSDLWVPCLHHAALVIIFFICWLLQRSIFGCALRFVVAGNWVSGMVVVDGWLVGGEEQPVWIMWHISLPFLVRWNGRVLEFAPFSCSSASAAHQVLVVSGSFVFGDLECEFGRLLMRLLPGSVFYPSIRSDFFLWEHFAFSACRASAHARFLFFMQLLNTVLFVFVSG
jgi:hypothetical protein